MLRMLTLFAAIAWGAGLASAQATRPSRMLTSPPRQVLIVQCNLQEAFSGEDVVDPSDMSHFADRVRQTLPVAPDVLLVCEVRGASAINVANFLSEVTGQKYQVAVAPGEKPLVRQGVLRETAVILNTSTMKALDAGGFVDTESSKGIREQARLLVQEIDGGEKLAVLSAHLNSSSGDLRDDVSHLAKELTKAYPRQDQMDYVIAGDFGALRAASSENPRQETRDAAATPWWNALTQQFGYVDAIFSKKPEEIEQAQHIGASRSDYIFVKGNVINAASDLEYVMKRSDPGAFYSDHRFVWARVGLERDRQAEER